MIRKLEEIYDYTHPLVGRRGQLPEWVWPVFSEYCPPTDAEGREVPAAPPHESCEGGRKIGRKQKRKETSELPASSTMVCVCVHARACMHVCVCVCVCMRVRCYLSGFRIQVGRSW